MKAELVVALGCALVLGAVTTIACGGSHPGPTTAFTADGGTVTNGTTLDRTPHEAAPREAAPRESAGHDHEHGH